MQRRKADLKYPTMARACLKKERGCVEDQPQHMASASTRREFKTCCGWSRTAQPRSGIFRHALNVLDKISSLRPCPFAPLRWNYSAPQNNLTCAMPHLTASTGSDGLNSKTLMCSGFTNGLSDA
jgi:hypothetical protein